MLSFFLYQPISHKMFLYNVLVVTNKLSRWSPVWEKISQHTFNLSPKRNLVIQRWTASVTLARTRVYLCQSSLLQEWAYFQKRTCVCDWSKVAIPVWCHGFRPSVHEQTSFYSLCRGISETLPYREKLNLCHRKSLATEPKILLHAFEQWRFMFDHSSCTPFPWQSWKEKMSSFAGPILPCSAKFKWFKQRREMSEDWSAKVFASTIFVKSRNSKCLKKSSISSVFFFIVQGGSWRRSMQFTNPSDRCWLWFPRRVFPAWGCPCLSCLCPTTVIRAASLFPSLVSSPHPPPKSRRSIGCDSRSTTHVNAQETHPRHLFLRKRNDISSPCVVYSAVFVLLCDAKHVLQMQRL